MKLFVEAEDHHLALTLWDATGSQEQLQEALDDVVGQVATNEIMPARLQASEDLEAAPMDQPLF